MNHKTENLFRKLVELCARLRREGGCMWDRKQDHSSLIPYLSEESSEVKEAIRNNDPDNLREELGDLLYQVIFHARIAAENNEFTIDDVIKGITEKIIRRHPHVFSDKKVSSIQEITENWNRIKEKEKEEE